MGLFDRAVEKAKEAASDVAQRAAPVTDRAVDAALDAYSAADEKSGGKLSETVERAKARARERAEDPASEAEMPDATQAALHEPTPPPARAMPEAKTAPSEAKLGAGQGRAWIEDGAFHFKRGLGVWGLPLNLSVPLDAIASVVLDEPSLQDHVQNAQYSVVRILGADRELARINNLMLWPGRHLYSFIDHRVSGHTARTS